MIWYLSISLTSKLDFKFLNSKQSVISNTNKAKIRE